MCYCYQVLEKFWLFRVEIKAVLGLSCVPDHAQDKYLILVWTVSAFGNGLCMKCSKVAIFNFSRVVISVEGILLLQDKCLMWTKP